MFSFLFCFCTFMMSLYFGFDSLTTRLCIRNMNLIMQIIPIIKDLLLYWIMQIQISCTLAIWPLTSRVILTSYPLLSIVYYLLSGVPIFVPLPLLSSHLEPSSCDSAARCFQTLRYHPLHRRLRTTSHRQLNFRSNRSLGRTTNKLIGSESVGTSWGRWCQPII